MDKNKLLLVFVFSVVVVIAVGAVFFVVTTTMSRPTSLELFLPKMDSDEAEGLQAAHDQLTLLLINDSTIYAYNSNQATSGKTFNYKTVREEIIKNKELPIIIKPTKTSTYKNTVDILDEMTLNRVKTYALKHVSTEEQELIDQFKQERK